MMGNVNDNMAPEPLRRTNPGHGTGARPGHGRGRNGARWKVHTPEAMCKAAFANLHSSFETKAVDGSVKSHAMKTTWLVANIITDACEQASGQLKRPLAEVEASGRVTDDVVDDFHINNNMFDESQLWLRDHGGRGPKKRRRLLASASQVTRRAPGGSTKDVDVLRPPATMKHYTAATCAGILGKPEDSAGLLPLGEATPKAKYFGTLTATDSHSVNILTSKWISGSQASRQPWSEDGSRPQGPTRVHVASMCAQHKTGNAVQQVTEYLGLIRPGFALASCLAAGDIADDLDFDLRVTLEMILEVIDPATLELDAPDETQHQKLLREIFEQCYVQASGHGTVLGDADVQEQKRRAEADEIVSFFAASRGRRLRHACPPGCCVPGSVMPAADRAASVKRAFGLVKRFVVPCISEPAANKYTKVDPVVRKLALATNFFGHLLRRAFARKFKDRVQPRL